MLSRLRPFHALFLDAAAASSKYSLNPTDPAHGHSGPCPRMPCPPERLPDTSYRFRFSTILMSQRLLHGPLRSILIAFPSDWVNKGGC